MASALNIILTFKLVSLLRVLMRKAAQQLHPLTGSDVQQKQAVAQSVSVMLSPPFQFPATVHHLSQEQ